MDISISHECEGGIEKPVSRIIYWHHEACRVMTNVDPEGHIFLSHPHMNMGFFSCSPLNNCIGLPRIAECAGMRHTT